MKINADFKVTDKEKIAYLSAIKDANGGSLEGVDEITLTQDKNDPDYVLVDFVVKKPKFERIRRITGYLTGTLDRWNDAKQAEEHDRVKHNI